MKHLIHISHPEWMFDNVLMLDIAEKACRDHDEVYILLCDSTVSICATNPRQEQVICTWCKHYRKKLCSLLSSGVKVLQYKEFYSPKIKEKVDSIKFNYDSVNDIKKLTYRDVYIGYAALSSYVSITRNLDPKIDENFKTYFNLYLKAQCAIVEILDGALALVKPDRVSLYNGRFFETRPFFDFSKAQNYPVWCYENIRFDELYNRSVVHFDDALPHSITCNHDLIEATWNDTNLTLEQKKEIGGAFFERRRNAMTAGDVVYTEKQKLGMLPPNWDSSKRNIIIFNSSEDEFVAIGDEYDRLKLFNSQIDGIKEILAEFTGESDFQFYLRIHPNLRNVKYKYHKDLIKLGEQFDNLTVILADDNVSSYTLMDFAEKVIVFGSTVGVEATYWGKPVILLAGAVYRYLDVCHVPQTKSDLIQQIRDNLSAKNTLNALKYGFFYAYDRGEKPTVFDFNWHFKYFNCIKKKIIILNCKKVKYSLLVLFFIRLVLMWLNRFHIIKSKRIPLYEA